MRALVVDDSLTCRLALESVLARFLEVDYCQDGIAAVRAARLALALGKPYDLICMDLVMPAMGGLEALQLIRQEEECRRRPRASKVIVVSCRDDSGSIEEAFGQLCDGYLVKPIDMEKLLTLVECLCEFSQPSVNEYPVCGEISTLHSDA